MTRHWTFPVAFVLMILCCCSTAQAQSKAPDGTTSLPPATPDTTSLPPATPDGKTSPPPAAQPAEPASNTKPKEEARQLFLAGNTLFAAGDYPGALAKFRQARKLYPYYKIDVNIAVTLNRLQRHAEALRYYEVFLKTADKVAPRDVVEEAQKEVLALRQKVAVLTIDGPPKGATLNIDGEQTLELPLPAGHYLEPGSHVVLIHMSGYFPHLQKLQLAAGQQRQLKVELKKDQVAAAPQDCPSPPPPEVSERDDPARPNRTEIAGVELVTGPGFWWSGKDSYNCKRCVYPKAESDFLGVGLLFRLLTLKKSVLYWTVLELSYVGAGANQRLATIGTRVGLQFNPGSSGRLRIQAGLALGYFHLAFPSVIENTEGYDRSDNEFTLDGFMISPTLHLDYRLSRDFTLGGGIRLPIGAGFGVNAPHYDSSDIIGEEDINPVMLLFCVSASWLR